MRALNINLTLNLKDADPVVPVDRLNLSDRCGPAVQNPTEQGQSRMVQVDWIDSEFAAHADVH
jgi:hypothetical protein